MKPATQELHLTERRVCALQRTAAFAHGALMPFAHTNDYDHRGNGRSGRPAVETLTLEQLAADADALRPHLGLRWLTTSTK